MHNIRKETEHGDKNSIVANFLINFTLYADNFIKIRNHQSQSVSNHDQQSQESPSASGRQQQQQQSYSAGNTSQSSQHSRSRCDSMSFRLPSTRTLMNFIDQERLLKPAIQIKNYSPYVGDRETITTSRSLEHRKRPEVSL